MTDLVLLIGTNPLPNYIVGGLLMKDYKDLKNLWLVHTLGTEKLAASIKKMLAVQVSNNVIIQLVCLQSESNPLLIERDVNERLVSYILKNKNSSVHFNYTGGTKAMAVNVHKALTRAFQEDRIEFSYLDAREHAIVYDDGTKRYQKLRKKVHISTEELIKLHDAESGKEDKKPPVWQQEVAKGLANIIIRNGLSMYEDWVNILTQAYLNHKSKSGWKVSDFDETDRDNWMAQLEKSINGEIFTLLNIIPREQSLLNDDGSFWFPGDAKDNKALILRLGATIDFLHGRWQEIYLFTLISELRQECECSDFSITDIALGLKVYLTKGKTAELDILIVSGYQLCGISCTTAYKEHLCKTKAFEIIHRVQQLGGENAKAILFTSLDSEKSAMMQADMQSILSQNNLVVFGIDDLRPEKFKNKLAAFLSE